MNEVMLGVIGFGAIFALALVMLVLERRAMAARKAARGGREIDISGLIAFGANPDAGGKPTVKD